MINLNEFLLFDGGMGTMLQDRGLEAGALPELLNLNNYDVVRQIHREYVAAGADIITANTFGANARKLQNSGASPREVITAGIRLAKESGAKYVALDIGPTGALLKPIGTMSFEEAYGLFQEQVAAGAEAGADIILIETMSDLLEAKAALLAAKENCNLPVFATMTFAEDGRTFLGTTPLIAAITLSSLGADAVGINCSLGPQELLPAVKEMAAYATVPVVVQANAGLPKMIDGNTVYVVSPDEYAESIREMISFGVSILGGCCGTTPEHIKKIRELIDSTAPVQRRHAPKTIITSGQNCVVLDGTTAVIGERINPTGKKKLKEALRSENYEYIIGEAIGQQECGADILDVNAGLPEIDEVLTLKKLIRDIQAVTPLPLQIDSSDPVAIEAAVRIYSGKPIINSVNGKKESMESVLPIVKKYGTAVVALTLDENGIPETAEGRFSVAEKIVNTALAYGIPREDILVDCLVLTASANQQMVMETLRGISLVKSRLGVKTVLGVSNVSFGLPNREIINGTFLAAAFGAGLDMPILNPMSEEYMKIVSAFKVLNNEDVGAVKYIENYAFSGEAVASYLPADEMDLGKIIITGRKSMAASVTRELLKAHSAMDIINNFFIPALDDVGKKFEQGIMFLPQLLASAETVQQGFSVLREASSGEETASKGTVLLATVKGDIHDIGKNIVRMLLENYGYKVVDLGKDVDPEQIVKATMGQNIKLVGLSALMTTTVKSMAETISLLHEAGADCKIVVGGAVLNEEYAQMVGADFYAKDAAETVRIAARTLG